MLNESEAGTVFVLHQVINDLDDLKFEHRNLRPYTSYSYTVTACTSVGCTDSDEVC